MTIRQERIRELIREHLSTLFLTDISDPALIGLTVTDVRVDREIEYADVYVHALGEDERREDVMAGLHRARGFIRTRLAKGLRIRHTPELHFHWDDVLENADHMERLLDSLDIPPEDDDRT
ncbi:MAG: 30S ribosome-binding factor RbfA [Anaerolineales bacterium]